MAHLFDSAVLRGGGFVYSFSSSAFCSINVCGMDQRMNYTCVLCVGCWEATRGPACPNGTFCLVVVKTLKKNHIKIKLRIRISNEKKQHLPDLGERPLAKPVVTPGVWDRVKLQRCVKARGLQAQKGACAETRREGQVQVRSRKEVGVAGADRRQRAMQQRNEAASKLRANRFVPSSFPCNEPSTDICCRGSAVQPDGVRRFDACWYLNQAPQPRCSAGSHSADKEK